MARPKSKDPVAAVSITLPKSLLRTARGISRGKNQSLSSFMAELIREYLLSVKKAMEIAK